MKRFLACLCAFLILCNAAQAVVAVDATGTDTPCAGATAFSYGPGSACTNATGITTTAAATAIVFILYYQLSGTTGTGPGATTVKWDTAGANQSFSLIATGTLEAGLSNTVQAFVYCLASPSTSGNKVISVTVANSNEPYLEAISFSGTDTVNPCHNGVGAGAPNGGTLNPSITVTSPSGEIAVAGNSFDQQTMSGISGTTIFNDTSGPLGGAFAHQTAGVGSTSMTANGSAADGWSYAAVSVQPPVSAATCPALPLLGVGC